MFLDLVKAAISPITNLIDEMHTSDDEKLEAKRKLDMIEADLTKAVLEHENKLIEAKSRIITAEAQSGAWLATNWRPITMLIFVGLVVFDTLFSSIVLAGEAWELIKLGLGGYIAARTGEKIFKKRYLKNE